MLLGEMFDLLFVLKYVFLYLFSNFGVLEEASDTSHNSLGPTLSCVGVVENRR